MLTNKQQGAVLLIATGVAFIGVLILLDMFGVINLTS